MENKKLSEYKFSKVNPFVDETVQHIVRGNRTIFMGSQKEGVNLVDKSSSEIVGHSVFAKTVKLDKTEFRKVYVSSISSWFGLSKTGIKVFGYVLASIRPNSDVFFMDYDDCSEFTSYKSKKSIVDGLKELIENKFIARGPNNYTYFINPTIFFNGNRLTYVNSFVASDDPPQITDVDRKSIESFFS